MSLVFFPDYQLLLTELVLALMAYLVLMTIILCRVCIIKLLYLKWCLLCLKLCLKICLVLDIFLDKFLIMFWYVYWLFHLFFLCIDLVCQLIRSEYNMLIFSYLYVWYCVILSICCKCLPLFAFHAFFFICNKIFSISAS